MKKCKIKINRREENEDIKKIIFIAQHMDYSDRDKVRNLCAWLLKNPEIFSSAAGKRYVRELRKSALNLEEDFQCILCGRRIEKDYYFCSDCYQKAILKNLSRKKAGFTGRGRYRAGKQKDKETEKQNQSLRKQRDDTGSRWRRMPGNGIKTRVKQRFWMLIMMAAVVFALIFGIQGAAFRFFAAEEAQLAVSEELAKAASLKELTVQEKQFYLEENKEQKEWNLVKGYKKQQLQEFGKMMEELYRQGNSVELALEISSKHMRKKYHVLLYTVKLESLSKEEIADIYKEIAEEKTSKVREDSLPYQQDEKKRHKKQENQKNLEQIISRPVSENGKALKQTEIAPVPELG